MEAQSRRPSFAPELLSAESTSVMRSEARLMGPSSCFAAVRGQVTLKWSHSLDPVAPSPVEQSFAEPSMLGAEAQASRTAIGNTPLADL